MKNILVPTDFSKNAFHALRYASTLLKDNQCTFYLLNVYGGGKGFKSKSLQKNHKSSGELRKASQARLDKVLEKIKRENIGPEHSYKLISKGKELLPAVHSLIDDMDIDLIVLGNKGEKSSIPAFLGSNTVNTLNNIKICPILTVPTNAKLDIDGEIAFASDFKRTYNTRNFAPLRSLALLTNTPIRIVHIDEEEKLEEHQKSNLDHLLTYFDPLAYSVERIPNFISKTKILQLFLGKSNIAMLCMVHNEHGILEKMLREPVVEKMISHIDIPFLVLPEA